MNDEKITVTRQGNHWIADDGRGRAVEGDDPADAVMSLEIEVAGGEGSASDVSHIQRQGDLADEIARRCRTLDHLLIDLETPVEVIRNALKFINLRVEEWIAANDQ